jgi:hypothetical protein
MDLMIMPELELFAAATDAIIAEHYAREHSTIKNLRIKFFDELVEMSEEGVIDAIIIVAATYRMTDCLYAIRQRNLRARFDAWFQKNESRARRQYQAMPANW